MSRDRRTDVVRHLTEEDLERLLAGADDPTVVRRLIFIKNLYAGDTLEEAANRIGKSASTGSRWVRRWNDGGLGKLTPNFGGGAGVVKAGPAVGEETLLTAEFSRDERRTTKAYFDAMGHYTRWDAVNLEIRDEQYEPVHAHEHGSLKDESDSVWTNERYHQQKYSRSPTSTTYQSKRLRRSLLPFRSSSWQAVMLYYYLNNSITIFNY